MFDVNVLRKYIGQASNLPINNGTFDVRMDSSCFNPWRAQVLSYLNQYGATFDQYINVVAACNNGDVSDRDECVNVLKLILENHDAGVIKFQSSRSDSIEMVTKILENFHSVARTLQDRHDDRSTIVITDEYDVQDLIHALLRLHFDDVRPEECTPSYAGKSARTDFLIKSEKIILEVKIAAEKHGAKAIGDELIIDKERYSAHQDCQNLVCFVYDPSNAIRNPRGLENDLRQEVNPKTIVLVRP